MGNHFVELSDDICERPIQLSQIELTVLSLTDLDTVNARFTGSLGGKRFRHGKSNVK